MMKYQDFIPPILNRLLMKLFPLKTQSAPPTFYSTYAEAQEVCSSAGYEDTGLVEIIFEKTRLAQGLMLDRKFPLSDSMSQSLLAVLFALRICKKQKRLKVIDFGGACGAHYFQICPFFPPDVQIDWVVVETKAMVEKAKAFETKELRFCNSLREAREKLHAVDLVHSSGALQYVTAPGTIVQEFIMCHPTYIFLNRLVLSAAETLISIQESLLSANGPGALPEGLVDKLCRYPITYFSKRHLEEMLSQNYQMKVGLSGTKTLVGEKEIIVNAGMLVERF